MSRSAAPSPRPEVYRRQQERDAASAATHYRFPNKPFPHSMLLVFKEYDYSNFQNQSYTRQLTSAVDQTGRLVGRERGKASVSLRSERSIELPFPKQLTDNTNPIINTMSRDPFVEQATNELMKAVGGVGNKNISDIPGMIQGLGAATARKFATATGEGAMGAVVDTLKSVGATNIGEAATLAAYLGRSVLNAFPGDIAKNINLATGNIINPRETLSFEGVQLRTHQFTWDLYPSNVDDSKRIQEIVSIIKRSILPRTQGLGVGNFDLGKVFLKYPHVLEMYLIGVRDGYFVKFKPCFVTNMSVDYAAGGTLGIMKGGRPAGVTISMSMQELQIETAHDYGEEEIAENSASNQTQEPEPSGATTYPVREPRIIVSTPQ